MEYILYTYDLGDEENGSPAVCEAYGPGTKAACEAEGAKLHGDFVHLTYMVLPLQALPV